MKPCACGCGGMVKTPDSRGRERRWLKGHQAKKAIRVDRNQPVEIDKPCKQCGRNLVSRRGEIGFALKRRSFCCVRCKSIWFASRVEDKTKATAAMRAAAILPENVKKRIEARWSVSEDARAEWSKMAHSKEAIAKAVETRSKNPIFQSCPSHNSAKIWRLRDANGVPREFKNLSCFIRDNPHLFSPDDLVVRWGKGLTRTRAYAGISSIRPRPNAVRVNGVWKGWTWISIVERRFNGAEDLLDRAETGDGGGGAHPASLPKL